MVATVGGVEQMRLLVNLVAALPLALLPCYEPWQASANERRPG